METTIDAERLVEVLEAKAETIRRLKRLLADVKANSFVLDSEALLEVGLDLRCSPCDIATELIQREDKAHKEFGLTFIRLVAALRSVRDYAEWKELTRRAAEAIVL